MVPDDSLADPGARLERLQRRADRAVRARQAAEAAAEAGLRELYERQGYIDLLRQIAAEANSASSVEAGLQRCLELIGRQREFAVGHVYFRRGDVLVSSAIWFLSVPDRFASLVAASEGTVFESGVGLPGRVLATGGPVVSRDVRVDPNFPRNRKGSALGVVGGLAFPVGLGGEITAVVELFSLNEVVLDGRWIEFTRDVGIQLGYLIERGRSREWLEATVESRTAELRAARDAALASARAKSEFLANMSHEIRTPLNAVLGMTTLLVDSGLRPEQRELAVRAAEAGDVLLGIVNDVLEFSRMEAGQVAVERVPVAVTDLLDRVTAMLGPRAREKGIGFDMFVARSVPPLIVGDATRLQQILINLVGNAVKFTERGRVRVAVEAVDDPAPQLAFEVVDTGIGVPADQLEHIFEKFTQADASTTRRFGGSGLGLAICRQLVDLMGGSIGVTSEPGVGSRFWFRIPLERAVGGTGSAESSTDRAEPGAINAHILLVDDSEMNRFVAQNYLARLGCRVSVAADGHEAVTAATATSFDLILMDCQMPVMDGYQATGKIRQLDGAAGRVPIIAMTAHALAGEREKCLAAGMDDHLPKPVRPADLAAALRRNLRRPTDTQPPAVPAVAEVTLQGVRDAALGHAGSLATALATAFLADAPERIAHLRTALATGDRSAVRLQAHTLKSMGLILGAAPLAEVSAALEQQAASVGGVDVGLLDRIEVEFARVRAALEESLHPTAVAAAAPPLDPLVLAQLEADGLAPSLAPQLMRVFRTESPRRLAELGDALSRRDADRAVAVAHNLRGMCLVIGAAPLADLCQAIERLAPTGDQETFANARRRLDRESARLQEALASAPQG
ncbi:MAG: ATP-binding protein [Gemmatimonadales bacterium]|nr:ATP-binding protein [Gemmatimonadales bacterium]